MAEAYVEAVNAARFCDVVNSFQAHARPEVALTAFKALTLLAGGQGPKREAYRTQFNAFSKEHGLNFKSEAEFLGLFLKVANGMPIPNSGQIEQAIAKVGPEAFYVDAMTRVLHTDPSARATYRAELSNLHVQAELATAEIVRADGHHSEIAFRQTPDGWVLTTNQR